MAKTAREKDRSAGNKTPPPDLTTLAKKNNGVFPVISVYRNIDGRNLVESHEGREMPYLGMSAHTTTSGRQADTA
jgi:hypothetical protein